MYILFLMRPHQTTYLSRINELKVDQFQNLYGKPTKLSLDIIILHNWNFLWFEYKVPDTLHVSQNVKREKLVNTMLQKIFTCVLFLFGLNILSGILPEYGKSGGWDYSPEAAQRDCAEYRRAAKVYHIDQDQRYYFECIK